MRTRLLQTKSRAWPGSLLPCVDPTEREAPLFSPYMDASRTNSLCHLRMTLSKFRKVINARCFRLIRRGEQRCVTLAFARQLPGETYESVGQTHNSIPCEIRPATQTGPRAARRDNPRMRPKPGQPNIELSSRAEPEPQEPLQKEFLI